MCGRDSGELCLFLYPSRMGCRGLVFRCGACTVLGLRPSLHRAVCLPGWPGVHGPLSACILPTPSWTGPCTCMPDHRALSQAQLRDSTPGAPGCRPPLPHTIKQVLKATRSIPCLPLEPPLLPSGHQRLSECPPLYTLAPHGPASGSEVAFTCFPPFWQLLPLRDSWVRQSLPPRARGTLGIQGARL